MTINYAYRMERDGLVRRAPGPNDRRAYRICLTEAGRGAETPARRVMDRVLGKVFSGIGKDDLAGTTTVLQKVPVNLEEDSQ